MLQIQTKPHSQLAKDSIGVKSTAAWATHARTHTHAHTLTHTLTHTHAHTHTYARTHAHTKYNQPAYQTTKTHQVLQRRWHRKVSGRHARNFLDIRLKCCVMEQKRHMCTVDKRLCVVAANLPLHSLHPFTPSLQDIFSPHLSPLPPPLFFGTH